MHAQADVRRKEALLALNAIVDPCSVAAGAPLGIVDMGLVAGLHVDRNAVRVSLLPTFPGCLFVPVFQREIEAALLQLPWCRAVGVALEHDELWDESRLSKSGLVVLQSQRREAFGPRDSDARLAHSTRRESGQPPHMSTDSQMRPE